MKPFEEVYEKVIKSVDIEKVTYIRDKYKFINTFIINGLLVVLFVVNDILLRLYKEYDLIGFCVFLTIVIALIILPNSLKKLKYKYNKEYKEAILKELVKQMDEGLTYDPDNGIEPNVYMESGIDILLPDSVHTEDRIMGTLSNGRNIELSEVVTYKKVLTVVTSGKPKLKDKVIYNGVFGMYEMKTSYMDKIKVRLENITNRLNEKKVDINQEEFEKYFNVFAGDKEKTTQIFKTKVINSFLDFIKKTNSKMEIVIDKNKIYFRMDYPDLLEPILKYEPLDKEKMKNYYLSLCYPISVLESIEESISNIKQ